MLAMSVADSRTPSFVTLCGLSSTACTMGVSTNSGSTSQTVTPRPAHSMFSASVNPFTKNLVAEYTANAGVP